MSRSVLVAVALTATLVVPTARADDEAKWKIEVGAVATLNLAAGGGVAIERNVAGPFSIRLGFDVVSQLRASNEYNSAATPRERLLVMSPTAQAADDQRWYGPLVTASPSLTISAGPARLNLGVLVGAGLLSDVASDNNVLLWGGRAGAEIPLAERHHLFVDASLRIVAGSSWAGRRLLANNFDQRAPDPVTGALVRHPPPTLEPTPVAKPGDKATASEKDAYAAYLAAKKVWDDYPDAVRNDASVNRARLQAFPTLTIGYGYRF